MYEHISVDRARPALGPRHPDFFCGAYAAFFAYEQNKSDFDSFSAIIRKYVGIKELTPAIVNEFIKKIIVHAPEKVDGKRVQKVDIVFNFVGEINFLSATQPKRQGA